MKDIYNKKYTKYGFTLVELIVVIAIMGIILILALPQVSRIQSANKNKKYEAYKESLEAAAKIYIDNHAKDLFGNNPTGCVTITYSDLKNDNLIKDFGEDGVDCSNDDETFVDVTKINDEYKYSTDLICYKGTNKAFEDKDSTKAGASVCESHGGGECEGEDCNPDTPKKPDSDPPEIDIDPDSSGNKWYNAERINSVLKLKIVISDQNGLNANTSISWTWKQLDGSNVEIYKHNFKNDKLTSKNSKLTLVIPKEKIPSDSSDTGKYRLTVSPDNSNGWGIQDALGNERLRDEIEEEYWIDNTPPTMDPKIKSTSTKYNALTTTITMNGNDNIGLGKVYISNTGYETGGSWKDYSDTISWNVGGTLDGEKRKIYITLMDDAGNKIKKKIEYTVYKECTDKSPSETNLNSCPSCADEGTTYTVKISYKDDYTSKVCSTKTTERVCDVPTCGPPAHTHQVGYVGKSVFQASETWYDQNCYNSDGSKMPHYTYRKGYCKVCYDHGEVFQCRGRNHDCLSGVTGGWLSGSYNCEDRPYYDIVVPD